MAGGDAHGCIHTTMTVMGPLTLQDDGHTSANRLTATCSLVFYRTFALWFLDTCQIEVSDDRYHVTILWSQVKSSSRSYFFLFGF